MRPVARGGGGEGVAGGKEGCQVVWLKLGTAKTTTSLPCSLRYGTVTTRERFDYGEHWCLHNSVLLDNDDHNVIKWGRRGKVTMGQSASRLARLGAPTNGTCTEKKKKKNQVFYIPLSPWNSRNTLLHNRANIFPWIWWGARNTVTQMLHLNPKLMCRPTSQPWLPTSISALWVATHWQ